MMYYSKILLYLEVKTGNKMSGKKEERKGILFKWSPRRNEGANGG